jgi:hypothetical protein
MRGVEWYLELSGTTRRRIRIAIPLGGDLRKSVGAFAASYAPSRGCQTLSHAPRGHRECQRYTQGFQARIISIISWNFMWVPALRPRYAESLRRPGRKRRPSTRRYDGLHSSQRDSDGTNEALEFDSNQSDPLSARTIRS